MSQRTRATWIGAFAFAGLFLFGVFLLLLGKGGWFSTHLEYTMFFDKSVKGLSVGAPVMLRGVKIGSVSDIRLACFEKKQAGSQDSQWPIEVRIRIDPKIMMARQNAGLKDRLQRRFFDSGIWKRDAVEGLIRDLVVDQGMRAQLQNLSLMTGKVCIELNFFPLESRGGMLEIERKIDDHVMPVNISIFEKMFLSVANRNLDDYVNNFHAAMDQLGAFVRQGRFRKMLEDGSVLVSDARKTMQAGQIAVGVVSSQASGVLARLDALADELRKETAALGEELRTRLEDLRTEVGSASRRVGEAADSSRRLADAVREQVDRNGDRVAALVEGGLRSIRLLERDLEQGRRLIGQLRETTAEDSPVRRDLTRSLNEVEKAAMALKNLADLLQRSPDALLRGN